MKLRIVKICENQSASCSLLFHELYFLSWPDAVLVQGVQVLFGALGLWGPTVQVLEALPSTDALLGRLLRNVQLAAKRQAAFGAVVHEQHRVTVVALEDHKRVR